MNGEDDHEINAVQSRRRVGYRFPAMTTTSFALPSTAASVSSRPTSTAPFPCRSIATRAAPALRPVGLNDEAPSPMPDQYVDGGGGRFLVEADFGTGNPPLPHPLPRHRVARRRLGALHRPSPHAEDPRLPPPGRLACATSPTSSRSSSHHAPARASSTTIFNHHHPRRGRENPSFSPTFVSTLPPRIPLSFPCPRAAMTCRGCPGLTNARVGRCSSRRRGASRRRPTRMGTPAARAALRKSRRARRRRRRDRRGRRRGAAASGSCGAPARARRGDAACARMTIHLGDLAECAASRRGAILRSRRKHLRGRRPRRWWREGIAAEDARTRGRPATRERTRRRMRRVSDVERTLGRVDVADGNTAPSGIGAGR